MTVESGVQLEVADEVWIATAILHREHPAQPDFAIDEIMERAAKEAGRQPLRPGVYVHVVQHCVYRMLHESAPGRRRVISQG